MLDGKHKIEQDLRSLGRRISDQYAGMRIEKYLAENFPFLSECEWNNRCQEGRIYVCNRVVMAGYKLQLHDRIYHLYPASCEPEVNQDVFCFRRVWDVRAFYKPSNLPMHEGGAYRANTFARIVSEKWGEDYRAVHRLDRDTSGIVICSSFVQSRRRLAQAWKNQRIHKIYYGIVIGCPALSRWEVNAPIGYAEHTIWREKRWVNNQCGADAQTVFEVIDRSANFALVKIIPKQGRTHQIRIHAAYSGYPLVGDVRYQKDEHVFLDYLANGYAPFVLKEVMAPRLCLHCAEIHIPSNVLDAFSYHRSSTISFSLPIPWDMRWIWYQLRLYPDQPVLHIPKTFHQKYAQKYHSL